MHKIFNPKRYGVLCQGVILFSDIMLITVIYQYENGPMQWISISIIMFVIYMFWNTNLYNFNQNWWTKNIFPENAMKNFNSKISTI